MLDVMDFGEVECCFYPSNSQGLSCLACCKRKVERSSSFPGELYYCFKTTPLTMCKKYLSSVKVSLGRVPFREGIQIFATSNQAFCQHFDRRFSLPLFLAKLFIAWTKLFFLPGFASLFLSKT